MYSINVFLTFSLSMVGMLVHWWQERGRNPLWKHRFALFLVEALLCLSILGVTIRYKLLEGGYVTILVTGTCIALAHAHSPLLRRGQQARPETERSARQRSDARRRPQHR